LATIMLALAIARCGDEGGTSISGVAAGAVLLIAGAGVAVYASLRYRAIARELAGRTFETARSTTEPSSPQLRWRRPWSSRSCSWPSQAFDVHPSQQQDEDTRHRKGDHSVARSEHHDSPRQWPQDRQMDAQSQPDHPGRE
jgi:hypothetical protein